MIIYNKQIKNKLKQISTFKKKESKMKIETNKYVTLAYELHVGEEDERELMERATKEIPLEFIYGTGSYYHFTAITSKIFQASLWEALLFLYQSFYLSS